MAYKGENEVSVIKVRAGDREVGRDHCPFSVLPAQSWQAGTISEIPSTWLILFALRWRPLRLCPTEFTGPPKLLFCMNGWSWLMLHNFLNHLKQATASLREPPAPVLLAKWPQD